MNSEHMNAATYAKKLRDRLEEIKAGRAARAKKFARDMTNWRADIKDWIFKNYDKRIDAVKDKAPRNRYDRDNDWVSAFFKDCPEKPRKITDDAVCSAIRHKLKYLAVTGQKTIFVSESECKTFFGEITDEED